MENSNLYSILISVLISSVFGPLVLVLASKLLERAKDKVDMTASMQEIADQAVEELRKEREAIIKRERTYREDLTKLNQQVEKLERAIRGPFELKTRTTLRVHPDPKKPELEILETTGEISLIGDDEAAQTSVERSRRRRQ